MLRNVIQFEMHNDIMVILPRYLNPYLRIFEIALKYVA